VIDRGRRLDVDPTDSFQGLFKTSALPFRLNAFLEVLQRTTSTVFGKDARRFPRAWSGNDGFEMARKPLRLFALQQLHLGLFTWKQLGNNHHPALPASDSEALVVEIGPQNGDDLTSYWWVAQGLGHCKGVTPIAATACEAIDSSRLIQACQLT
jgi:hypothetical protein